MKFMRGTMVMIGILSLGACSGFNSHTEVEALNEAEAIGSPFTQKLASEYRDYANNEQNVMFDYPDALHFARKGLAASAGEVVMPEPVGDWNLSASNIEELTAERARLIVAFDLGAREVAPIETAIAQAKFDCWIERQEENWGGDASRGCRTVYMDTMNTLEGLLQSQPAAPIEPEIMEPIANNVVIQHAPAEPVEPMAVEDAMYLVFFDFDSSNISSGARNVVSAVADELSKRNNVNSINIVGHTDTSGPSTYNDRLAMRRAKAVQKALIEHGIPADMVNITSKGENELLVQTPDNMREPANRRVNISFE